MIGAVVAQGKTRIAKAPCPVDRWAHVAFLNGKLAAGAGSPSSTNPHPLGSTAAQGWLDGWHTYNGLRPDAALPAVQRRR